jgi:hypothetical protein
MLKLLLVIPILCLANDAGYYHTYSDHTVVFSRESEFGVYDTVKIEHITSVTNKGKIVELKVVGQTEKVVLEYPKERIIQEFGE